jgi:hypothetical protein
MVDPKPGDLLRYQIYYGHEAEYVLVLSHADEEGWFMIYWFQDRRVAASILSPDRFSKHA